MSENMRVICEMLALAGLAASAVQDLRFGKLSLLEISCFSGLQLTLAIGRRPLDFAVSLAISAAGCLALLALEKNRKHLGRADCVMAAAEIAGEGFAAFGTELIVASAAAGLCAVIIMIKNKKRKETKAIPFLPALAAGRIVRLLLRV